ncbi:uncharacterized protein A4U43_C07F9080 [Asparagus officinalis]|uniref:Uncharacterized protein n=1 Tax=Asparagus officinalis TaxID=4686 RepID=A0A5P1EDK3_ASPOF|nr:uncharacterized protein A4U43_C07F9080 [Asparagus officinalis]
MPQRSIRCESPAFASLAPDMQSRRLLLSETDISYWAPGPLTGPHSAGGSLESTAWGHSFHVQWANRGAPLSPPLPSRGPPDHIFFGGSTTNRGRRVRTIPSRVHSLNWWTGSGSEEFLLWASYGGFRAYHVL